MTRLIQIVPNDGVRLYGSMVQKEIDLSRSGKGTFFRTGKKEKDKAKWSHAKYKGWLKLQRAAGEVVTVEVRSLSQGRDQWQLLHAFIGWIDRHFDDQIEAINIQYRDEN